jgi:Sideroflexins
MTAPVSTTPSALDLLLSTYKFTHPVKPFVSGTNLYDQGAYLGRVRHLFRLLNPFDLRFTNDDIAKAKHALSNTQNYTDRELWNFQHILNSTQSNQHETLPFYARLAFFLPANAPITAGMLGASSPMAIFGWQFFNQSYNALFNVVNSPKGFESIEKVTVPYLVATTVACSLAVGLKKVIHAPKYPWLVPYIAVAMAGGSNTFLMRRQELNDGISVQITGDNQSSNSKKAALIALGFSILTRNILLPLPLLALPSYIYRAMNLGFAARNTKWIKTSAEVISATIAMAISFPLCVAAVPQNLTVSGSWLEKEFHQHTQVNFNRGL